MRRKQPSREEMRNQKLLLYDRIKAGELTIGQATRAMRLITGLTQKEYAEKVLGIYPRVLMDLEKDKGNPTLETLVKVAKPFGLTVGFIYKERFTGTSDDARPAVATDNNRSKS